MSAQKMTSVERQAVWDRCRLWQTVDKTDTIPEKISKEENHDHDFKKNNNHDHDQSSRSLEKTKKDTTHDGKTLFRIVNQDPDFVLALSWGLWPQALYNACQSYGLNRVRQAILLVKNYTGVKNKAAYCMAVIKNPPNKSMTVSQ